MSAFVYDPLGRLSYGERSGRYSLLFVFLSSLAHSCYLDIPNRQVLFSFLPLTFQFSKKTFVKIHDAAGGLVFFSVVQEFENLALLFVVTVLFPRVYAIVCRKSVFRAALSLPSDTFDSRSFSVQNYDGVVVFEMGPQVADDDRTLLPALECLASIVIAVGGALEVRG